MLMACARETLRNGELEGHNDLATMNMIRVPPTTKQLEGDRQKGRRREIGDGQLEGVEGSSTAIAAGYESHSEQGASVRGLMSDSSQ